MTLDQLETFLTVANEGSFKAASEVLHRSQPALSVAVKKLEEELGIQLFSREQYRPELTSEGRAFYHRAREFFDQAKGLERYGRQLGLGEEPEISVAVDALCPLDFILKSFESFSELHPDTRFNLSFEILGGAAEKVDEGTVQLAISPRIGLQDKKLKLEHLGSVDMIPVISKNLPPKYAKRTLSTALLKNIPQIIVRETSSRPSFRTYGVLQGARQWSVQDMGTKREIIKAGLGWGRLPDHLAQEDLEKGLLREIKLGDMMRESVDICLMHSEVHPMGPLSQKLWDILMASRF